MDARRLTVAPWCGRCPCCGGERESNPHSGSALSGSFPTRPSVNPDCILAPVYSKAPPTRACVCVCIAPLRDDLTGALDGGTLRHGTFWTSVNLRTSSRKECGTSWTRREICIARESGLLPLRDRCGNDSLAYTRRTRLLLRNCTTIRTGNHAGARDKPNSQRTILFLFADDTAIAVTGRNT